MPPLSIFIAIAGALHLGVLIASALVPQVLDWRNELRALSPMTRHLVWVHGSFIVLVIIGFGVLSLLNAPALASGDRLARSLCGFIAVFWAARLSLQFFLFDPQPYLRSVLLRVGHHGLTIVFAYFTVVYGWATVAAHP